MKEWNCIEDTKMSVVKYWLGEEKKKRREESRRSYYILASYYDSGEVGEPWSGNPRPLAAYRFVMLHLNSSAVAKLSPFYFHLSRSELKEIAMIVFSPRWSNRGILWRSLNQIPHRKGLAAPMIANDWDCLFPPPGNLRGSCTKL